MTKTDDTRSMLRTIINNQSTLKQAIIKRIDEVEEKLESKIDKVDKKLTIRIDAIGRQLAYLEDDAPTREEFDILENRVNKLERKSSPAL